MKRTGRRQPYTDVGIRRLKCVKCGDPARFQWNACADGNLWRPLCARCDVELNRIVLTWIGDPDADEKITAYARAKGIAT